MTPDPPPTIDYASPPSVDDGSEPASSMSLAGFGVATFVLVAASFPWVGIVAFGLTFFGWIGWGAAAAVLFCYVAVLFASFLLCRRIKATEDSERGLDDGQPPLDDSRSD